MTISIGCRVETKILPRNDNKNIAFTGVLEDIEFSRKIVDDFYSRYGRPRSNSYLAVRMLQHKDDPRYIKIWDKLKNIKSNYDSQIKNARDAFGEWLNQQNLHVLNAPAYIEKLIEVFLNKKIGNCGEHAGVIQYKHLQRGIETHNVGLRIYDKQTGEYLRDHTFSLRNLRKDADLENPNTWGNAILIDSWSGKGSKRGIVEKAVKLREKDGRCGLFQVLDFLCYDPKKEIIIFYKSSYRHAEEVLDRFIADMRAEKLEKRTARTKK